ncbi:hypothetical protein T459_00481 [Capsicum annuum]|uniref:KIB1-4 beta-propeller domain-containing protein n=1 Tax=Capsicum annuum TaxID=4072 RepID=A0A2G3AED8_CAPAN|nr:hypothetical protein T459_00481 [Capsicum annuum]
MLSEIYIFVTTQSASDIVRSGPRLARGLLTVVGCGEGLIWSCMERAVLSASPSLTSDYVLLVYDYGCGGHLAFWRPRDLNWTYIIGDWCGLSGINYYKGQFYSVSWNGKVWVFDVAEPQPLEPHLLVRLKDEIWNRHSLHFYLVELVGFKPLKGNNTGIQFKSWPQKQRWSLKKRICRETERLFSC